MRKFFSVLLGLIAGLLVLASPASAVETVIQDDAALLHSPTPQLREHMDKIRELGIQRVRLTAGWSVIAPDPTSTQRPSFDAGDPSAYPYLAWGNLDRAVRLADEAGLEVLIDVAFWAPRWATATPSHDPAEERTGIDPEEFALFSQAVATRYGGGYAPIDQWKEGDPDPPKPSERPGGLAGLFYKPEPQPEAPPPPALPKVDMYTLWNEPNHPGFMMPQWEKQDGKWVITSADQYRAMVHAAYPVVKKAAPDSVVLVGGTSSMGSEPGRGASPPLAFLRRLACVDDKLKPIRDGGCADFKPIPGDGWAHHPYSLRTRPDVKPRLKDNAPVANTPELSLLLRRLIGRGRLAHDVRYIYMTEYGYETKQPDPQAVFGLNDQVRNLAAAEKIALEVPDVRMWAQFQLIDRPGHRAGPNMRPFGDWQSGLYFEDGKAKPAAATYKTPTVARCVRRDGRTWVDLWARTRDGKPNNARVQSSPKDSATWNDMRHRATPQARAAARVSVPLANHDHGTSRYIPYRHGARYRVTWQETTQDHTITGAALRPTGCPSPPKK